MTIVAEFKGEARGENGAGLYEGSTSAFGDTPESAKIGARRFCVRTSSLTDTRLRDSDHNAALCPEIDFLLQKSYKNFAYLGIPKSGFTLDTLFAFCYHNFGFDSVRAAPCRLRFLSCESLDDADAPFGVPNVLCSSMVNGWATRT